LTRKHVDGGEKIRQYGFPYGHGFGHHGFHHGFPFFGHGFGRRLFPFFFLNPFFGFGFRDGEERNRSYYAEHVVEQGDTMWKIAQKYNVPLPILITMNTHIQNPENLNVGDRVYIPRMCDMYCQRMYMEREAAPQMSMPPQYPFPME
jgi:hypothetical protein